MPTVDYSEHLNLACIDLSNPDLTATSEQIRKACVDSGFFYVVHHGIEQDTFDEVFDQSRRLFALPEEEKMKMLRNKNHRGYTPYQAEALNPSLQSEGDWKESYYIGPDASGTSVDQEKPFHGPNQWPSTELLPCWREIMEDYYEKVLSTLHRVVINAQERYSVAFFLDPNVDCLVECLPSCCTETNPARFPPIRSGDYLQERIKMTYSSTH